MAAVPYQNSVANYVFVPSSRGRIYFGMRVKNHGMKSFFLYKQFFESALSTVRRSQNSILPSAYSPLALDDFAFAALNMAVVSPAAASKPAIKCGSDGASNSFVQGTLKTGTGCVFVYTCREH